MPRPFDFSSDGSWEFDTAYERDCSREPRPPVRELTAADHLERTALTCSAAFVSDYDESGDTDYAWERAEHHLEAGEPGGES